MRGELAVRSFRWIVPMLVALSAMVLIPGSATAAPPQTDQIRGLEYSATSSVGKFAGAATGPLPGGWNATVVHVPLSSIVDDAVPITGGSFSLYTFRTITGRFTGGTVTLIESGPNCRNEKYRVVGTLGNLDDGGSGRFDVTLIHHRRPLGGSCVAYGATVAGSLVVG